MSDPQSDRIDEVVPSALAGERLDRVVAMITGCSRSAAADAIADGEVTVDDVVSRQRSLRLDEGARIVAPAATVAGIAVEPDPDVEVEVVFEDDDIVVVNKSAGLVVHPGAGRPDKTLVNGLLARFPDIAAAGPPDRPGIVHRLDATTTGLLVVARNPTVYAHLVGALSARTVERTYTAVTHGLVVDERGVIDAPIGRSTNRRTRMAVSADGRVARTHYEVVDRSSAASEVSLLRCRLETGRTHQIRVHLAAIDHPVVGDAVYGARASVAFDRVALHAARLCFAHPTTGEWCEFDAPLPEDMTRLLDSLSLVSGV